MAEANADQVTLAYIEETTFKTARTGSNLQKLRFTGEDLGQDTSTTRSAEIRDDRQTSEIIRTSTGASGTISTELNLTTYSDWLASGLMDSAWSAAVTETSSAIYFTAPSTINHQGSFAQTYVAGQWIKVSGAAAAANNGYFKIASVASGAITLDQATLSTAAATPSITLLQGPYIENGTNLDTYNIERTYGGLGGDLELLLGMAIDSVSLEVAPESIVTAGFGFIGSSASSIGASVGTGYTEAGTTGPVNAVEDVTAIQQSSTYAAHASTAFSLNLSNNLRTRMEIGTLGAVSLGSGKTSVSGSLSAYYSDNATFDKYINFTDTSLAIIMEDGESTPNAMIIDLPSVKFTNGRRTAGGENSDIIATMDWEAFRNPTEDITIRIARFPS